MDVFSKFTVDSLKSNSMRTKALSSLVILYPIVMDVVKGNEDIFDYISKQVLAKSCNLSLYKTFYSRENKSIYSFFKENANFYNSSDARIIYKVVKEREEFNLLECMLIMVKRIPLFNGFFDADYFMTFFKEHLKELSNEDIGSIMKVYMKNSQCTNRSRHDMDLSEIKKHIEDQVF